MSARRLLGALISIGEYWLNAIRGGQADVVIFAVMFRSGSIPLNTVSDSARISFQLVPPDSGIGVLPGHAVPKRNQTERKLPFGRSKIDSRLLAEPRVPPAWPTQAPSKALPRREPLRRGEVPSIVEGETYATATLLISLQLDQFQPGKPRERTHGFCLLAIHQGAVMRATVPGIFL